MGMRFAEKKTYQVEGKHSDFSISSEQYRTAIGILEDRAVFWKTIDSGLPSLRGDEGIYLFGSGPSIVSYKEDIKLLEIAGESMGALEQAALNLKLPSPRK